ncbi:MAG UNVERIFIED_CONTAM: hypothetical protein LVR18_28195 [Planctomycetaceae bacterium]|jgi:hypothetical protein
MATWTLPAIIEDWCDILTSVLDRRSRKYFFTIILGMLLRCGRRTVSCWLRAAGVSDDWQDHYYFLQTLGRKAKQVRPSVPCTFRMSKTSPDPGFDLFKPAGERRNSGHRKEKAVRLFRRTVRFEEKSG